MLGLQAELVEGGVFHFDRKYYVEGTPPPTNVGVRKLKAITFSCGIKISAVRSFVLSQSTRVTDRRMEGQICDLQYHASIAASCGKKQEFGMQVGTWSHVVNNKNESYEISYAVTMSTCFVTSQLRQCVIKSITFDKICYNSGIIWRYYNGKFLLNDLRDVAATWPLQPKQNISGLPISNPKSRA